MAIRYDNGRLIRVVLISFGVISLFLFWLVLYTPVQHAWGGQAHQQSKEDWEASNERDLQDVLDSIQNGTLGFDKVFAINLASRTDKRDNIVLGSSFTGIDVSFVDGVDPTQVNPKAIPYNWNHAHSETEFACRQAHVNLAEKVITQKLGSALVLEDDADWDISIKAQLQNFARATRSIQATTANFTESPYGHDWDMLWLGHCGMKCKTDQPHYTTPNDPTIVMPQNLPVYFHGTGEYNLPDHTRLACTVSDAACTTGYAISYRGAQKILTALSVNPSAFHEQINTSDQIDIVLGRMCQAGFLRCFAPFPSMLGGYQSAGLSSKGTDQSGKEAGAHMLPASSHGVVYSTMLNIKRLMRGERTVTATWPDVAAQNIVPAEIHIEKGELHPPIHPADTPKQPPGEPENTPVGTASATISAEGVDSTDGLDFPPFS